MRGPAARVKYSLRRLSNFYVEKIHTYLHQNPGLPEQHGSTVHRTEGLGNHEVGALPSSCPAKHMADRNALWHVSDMLQMTDCI